MKMSAGLFYYGPMLTPSGHLNPSVQFLQFEETKVKLFSSLNAVNRHICWQLCTVTSHNRLLGSVPPVQWVVMASDSDETKKRLIEDFRPRLRRLIVVQQVLDHLHFIESDQKERIRQKEANDGNLAAADVLIAAVINKSHDPGWFQAFVDALKNSGCGYAADYMQVNPPEPEVEAENDYFVKLIEILSPGLVDMKTEEVCPHCLAQELLTQQDAEIVSKPV